MFTQTSRSDEDGDRAGLAFPLTPRASGHLVALAILSGLFAFRVGAQAVQAIFPVPGLPPFAAWYSGAVPYHLLLPAQLAILAVQAWIIARMRAGRLVATERLGTALLAAGSLYAAIMLGRLAIGRLVLVDAGWFSALIPTVFHLVLAGFVLVLGHYHAGGGADRR